MAELAYHTEGENLKISFAGDFFRYEAADGLYNAAENSRVHKIIADGSAVGQWDSSLLLVLFELQRIAGRRKIAFQPENLPRGLQNMLSLSLAVPPYQPSQPRRSGGFLEDLGGRALDIYQAFLRGWTFSAQSLNALLRFLHGQTVTRKIDFMFALEDCGPRAVGIVTLISFMVGLILAFVGAIQLKTFGAQVYVASLVTIGMIRIMGAIMVGVIMAGRTGASFAATLGTMQVNEEIDALKTMGIPVADFLVLPRLAAIVLTMPLLTTLADFAGMLGGGFVGIMLLDIPAGEYWKYSWQAWSMTNFWVGIFHGFVFGFIIALCGCYYGINSGRNADGVGVATTKAVVSAIVWMIVATGIITFIFERLGI